MIHINTTPVYGDHPIFEFKVDDLPSDSFFISEINWDRGLKRNSFSSKKQTNNVENVTKNLLNFFNKESITKVLTQLYEKNYDLFSYEYPLKSKYSLYEYIYNITRPVSDINLDLDGFNLSKHFDNRLIFGNFFLNLIDNQSSTKFYDYLNKDLFIYEAPKKKGEGVFFLNTIKTFHSVNVNSDRYILSNTICLNIND